MIDDVATLRRRARTPKMEARGIAKTFATRAGDVVALDRCDLADRQGDS
jgi:hypothetical protein